MLKIIFPEPAPSQNKGEGAILFGILAALDAGDRDYRISTFAPREWLSYDQDNYGAKCNVVTGLDVFDMGNKISDNPQPTTRFKFWSTWCKLWAVSLLGRISKGAAKAVTSDEFLREFVDADLVLGGHDGMMGSDQFLVAFASYLGGKPFIMYGGGGDERGVEGAKRQFYLQFAVKHSKLCVVRDAGTKEYLVDNGVDPELVFVYPDPAVLLPIAPIDDVHQLLLGEGIPQDALGNTIALIPVSGGIVAQQSIADASSPEDRWEQRMQIWAELVEHMLATTDAHFLFMPHCIGPTKHHDDRVANHDVYNRIQGDKSRLHLVDGDYTPDRLKGVMNNAQMVLGERTHALIGSVSAGSPCVALSVKEDLRMHYIINTMFERPVINMDHPDVAAIKAELTEQWQNRDETRKTMAVKAAEIRGLSEEAAGRLHAAIAKI